MSNLSPLLNRRKFIASSVGAIASASLSGLVPSIVRGQVETTETEATPKEIPSRPLGRTGITVPVLGMGTTACNDPGLVAASYEAGVRLFDTAPSYAYGRAEQMLGKGINQLKVRDKVLLATKCLTPAERRSLSPDKYDRRMREALEGSLRRMRTDYADILFIHDTREPDVPLVEEIQETMVALKKEGKARAIGITTHSNMASVINATVEAGVWDAVVTSFNFTMADDQEMTAAVANAHKKGVGVIAMKTQSGGANFPNPATLRDYPGSIINSAALKWVINNEAVTSCIPGMANYDHLRENVGSASNLAYSEEESKFLGDNRIVLGMGFCRQCSKCLASCPQDVDIPNLMRTHMYAAQYANFEMARNTLNEIGPKRGLANCSSCSECTAQCANAVDIPWKIDQLKLIYA